MTWNELLATIKYDPGAMIIELPAGGRCLMLRPRKDGRRQYPIQFFEDGSMWVEAHGRIWTPVVRGLSCDDMLKIITTIL